MQFITRNQIGSGSNGLFDNIGAKIKIIAKVLFGLGVVAGLVIAYFVSQKGNDNLAMIVFFVGILISWFSTYLLYGFGELVDNSQKIVDRLDILIDIQESEQQESYDE